MVAHCMSAVLVMEGKRVILWSLVFALLTHGGRIKGIEAATAVAEQALGACGQLVLLHAAIRLAMRY